jgi:prepilin-type N-terminal cleavage/methylation domain-containing protein
MLQPILRCRFRGFTLLEVIISCGLLAIIAGSGVAGLLRMNHNASLSRLQTGASTVAQNRIDSILSDGPFNPQKTQVPPVLALGTQTIGTADVPTIPIYTDPKTGVVTVMGWMTSTVADTALTYNGTSLNLYRATVTVFYQYHGKTYSVAMQTLRTSDI